MTRYTDEEDFPLTKFADKECFARALSVIQCQLAQLVYCKFANKLNVGGGCDNPASPITTPLVFFIGYVTVFFQIGNDLCCPVLREVRSSD